MAEQSVKQEAGQAQTQEVQHFHCTTCPSECMLTVVVEPQADGTVRASSVTGNRCPRGKAFAEQEVFCPVRVLASTVVVRGGEEKLLPVRTATAIPRAQHMEAMELIRHTAVDAPVKMGDVIIPNILGTGVDLVASMDVDKA